MNKNTNTSNYKKRMYGIESQSITRDKFNQCAEKCVCVQISMFNAGCKYKYFMI